MLQVYWCKGGFVNKQLRRQSPVDHDTEAAPRVGVNPRRKTRLRMLWCAAHTYMYFGKEAESLKGGSMALGEI